MPIRLAASESSSLVVLSAPALSQPADEDVHLGLPTGMMATLIVKSLWKSLAAALFAGVHRGGAGERLCEGAGAGGGGGAPPQRSARHRQHGARWLSTVAVRVDDTYLCRSMSAVLQYAFNIVVQNDFQSAR